MNLDHALLVWINQGWASPALDEFFLWVSGRAAFSVPLMLVILFDWHRRTGRAGVRLWFFLLALILFGDTLGNLLKDLFQEARPCFDYYQALRAPRHDGLYQCGDARAGLPSNHTLNFVLAALFVTLATPWRGWHGVLWVVALAVGLSRIYLGKHYPSQVLAGAWFGVLFAALGYRIALRLGFTLSTPSGPKP